MILMIPLHLTCSIKKESKSSKQPAASQQYIYQDKIQYIIPNTFSNKESIAQENSLHNQLKNFISYPLIVWGGGGVGGKGGGGGLLITTPHYLYPTCTQHAAPHTRPHTSSSLHKLLFSSLLSFDKFQPFLPFHSLQNFEFPSPKGRYEVLGNIGSGAVPGRLPNHGFRCRFRGRVPGQGSGKVPGQVPEEGSGKVPQLGQGFKEVPGRFRGIVSGTGFGESFPGKFRSRTFWGNF